LQRPTFENLVPFCLSTPLEKHGASLCDEDMEVTPLIICSLFLQVKFFDFYGRKLNHYDVGISCNSANTFFLKSDKE
jgi:hypothetical protein